MSVLWIDDFTTDHFHDGRYDAFAGADPGPGNHPGDGSWYIDGSGLEATWVGWSDPTWALGESVVAFVELTVAAWVGINARVGFTPPDRRDGSAGVYVSLATAGPGISLVLHDGATDIDHHFDAGATRVNPDNPIALRLAIDAWGTAYMGVGGPFGWFLPSVSPRLGGFGPISEETLALLPTCVPMTVFTGANRALSWAYGMATPIGRPSDIQAQSQAGGVVRTGPAAGGNSPSGVGIS